MADIPIISRESPILHVKCEKAFQALTAEEKLYAYYFTRASWSGSKICYFQRSYESPALFYLLQKVFLRESAQQVAQRLSAAGFSEAEVQQLFVYVSSFFQNCGNYKGFGDTKFVPELPQERFEQFLRGSLAYKEDAQRFDYVWGLISAELFNYTSPFYMIETIDKGGLSSYYSPNISKSEAESLTKTLEGLGISPLNTRVIKRDTDNTFEVLVASATKFVADQTHTDADGRTVLIRHGDLAEPLRQVNAYLSQALVYAANDNQKNMLRSYLEHFAKGSIDLHKESQKWWIKDKGPVVETNIGFIESYLDPIKVRYPSRGPRRW